MLYSPTAQQSDSCKSNMKFDVHEISKFLLSFLTLSEVSLKYILHKESKLHKPCRVHVQSVLSKSVGPSNCHIIESSDYRYARNTNKSRVNIRCGLRWARTLKKRGTEREYVLLYWMQIVNLFMHVTPYSVIVSISCTRWGLRRSPDPLTIQGAPSYIISWTGLKHTVMMLLMSHINNIILSCQHKYVAF